MRFEVKYPTGTPHEVELQGTLVTLGRDPACDLVLSDAKASRRHAVIEAGAQGLAIRDTGSANGIYVNSKKVERASLQPGDLVRIGEVIIKILPEEITGTVVMPPEELELMPGGAAPGPAAVPAAPGPVAPLPVVAPRAVVAPRVGPRRVGSSPRAASAGALHTDAALRSPARPLTVTVLAALWLFSLLLFLLGAVVGAAQVGWTSPAGLVSAFFGLTMAAVAAVMAFGLWMLKPWSRFLQIGIAALGLFLCPFSLASATVLFYMLRQEARLHFSGRPVPGHDEASRATELTFSLSLLGMVVLGALVAALGLWFGLSRRVAS